MPSYYNCYQKCKPPSTSTLSSDFNAQNKILAPQQSPTNIRLSDLAGTRISLLLPNSSYHPLCLPLISKIRSKLPQTTLKILNLSPRAPSL